MKYFDEEDMITEYEKQLQKKDNEIESLKEENNILCSIANNEKEKEEKILELLNRIYKAIEYIESNDLYYQDVDYDYEENMILGNPSDEQAKKDLIDILKGVDKE